MDQIYPQHYSGGLSELIIGSIWFSRPIYDENSDATGTSSLFD